MYSFNALTDPENKREKVVFLLKTLSWQLGKLENR